MVIIDGRKIRDEILSGLNPPKDKFLAAVLVGASTASLKFVEEKKKIADRLGIVFKTNSFPEDISGSDLKDEIKKICEDQNCGGLVLQLPLPLHVDLDVLNSIPAEKDVDALGQNSILPNPSISVVEEIFERQDIIPEDMVIAILGQGFLTGLPIAKWLRNWPQELLVLDKGDDLSQISRADMVISGVGQAKLFSAKQLKPGAGVIDFGTSFVDGKIVGDLDAGEDSEKLSFYTPTPGGTGPILIAMLFRNFCELNRYKK